MIIVSSCIIVGRNERHLSYKEFKEKAFSPEGLDVDDILMLNIHDVEPDVYQDCRGVDQIGFFSLSGTCPSWCDASSIQDWSMYQKGGPVDQVAQQPVNQVARPANPIEVPEQNYHGVGSQQWAVPEPSLPSREDLRAGMAPGVQPEQPQIPSMQQQAFNDAQREVESLLSDSAGDASGKGAKVFVFGSSKGGTGKTFTAIISTYRYAKTHPHQKIALVDFDIIDGQVGISIHKVKPTIRMYFSEYQKGYRDFRTMHEFAVHARDPFPQNVDFYLAPSNNARINDDGFWLNVIQNCIENYDVVVFDTGIDYINLRPISYVYKCADKILLITTTSIKSVNSVTKQIGRLKGEIPSKDDLGHNVFRPEDEIAKRLHVVITQMLPTNEMNRTIYNTLASKAPVAATFGVITDSVSRAEFYGEWNIFDKNANVNKYLDNIMS